MKPKPAALFFIFSLFTALLLSSCSSSEAKIDNVSYSVVFDFAQEQSLPAVRLSLFVESDQIQRVENINAVHDETGLVWKIENPRKVLLKDRKSWAGYTNLVAASGSKIPQGKYTVFYKQSSGEETQANIYVSYPKDLESKKTEEIPSVLPVGYSEKIALYNSLGELIYFSNRKSAWQTDSDIKREYPFASAKRKVFATGTNSIVCMLPKEALSQLNETSDSASSQKNEKSSSPEK